MVGIVDGPQQVRNGLPPEIEIVQRRGRGIREPTRGPFYHATGGRAGRRVGPGGLGAVWRRCAAAHHQEDSAGKEKGIIHKS